MILSDAPSCSITYNCHFNNSRGIIYDHNMFIVQAGGIIATLQCFHNFVSCYTRKVKNMTLFSVAHSALYPNTLYYQKLSRIFLVFMFQAIHFFKSTKMKEWQRILVGIVKTM